MSLSSRDRVLCELPPARAPALGAISTVKCRRRVGDPLMEEEEKQKKKEVLFILQLGACLQVD